MFTQVTHHWVNFLLLTISCIANTCFSLHKHFNVLISQKHFLSFSLSCSHSNFRNNISTSQEQQNEFFSLHITFSLTINSYKSVFFKLPLKTVSFLKSVDEKFQKKINSNNLNQNNYWWSLITKYVKNNC